jgi:hypothetical protein
VIRFVKKTIGNLGRAKPEQNRNYAPARALRKLATAPPKQKRKHFC